MSRTWYPMINYENCIECGACVNHCTHGVYNKQKAPRPVVIFPDGCIQGCTGCGSLCPSEAIEYFGDTKEGNGETNACCCQDGSGCNGDCDC